MSWSPLKSPGAIAGGKLILKKKGPGGQEMKVRVDPRDGTRKDPWNCAFSRACEKQIPNCFQACTFYWEDPRGPNGRITFNVGGDGDFHQRPLTPEELKWLHDWDEGLEVPEIEIEIPIPEGGTSAE